MISATVRRRNGMVHFWLKQLTLRNRTATKGDDVLNMIYDDKPQKCPFHKLFRTMDSPSQVYFERMGLVIEHLQATCSDQDDTAEILLFGISDLAKARCAILNDGEFPQEDLV
ncbi:hypothetical protein J6590_104899, partial [Homalodisca vitripennis]